MSDLVTAGSVEALHYDIDEGDGSIYRHDTKEVQLWISRNDGRLDPDEIIPEARELVRRANLFWKLMQALNDLARPLQAALDEKTSEQIYGGATPEERRRNWEGYQARIRQELARIPDVVDNAINLLREAET